MLNPLALANLLLSRSQDALEFRRIRQDQAFDLIFIGDGQQYGYWFAILRYYYRTFFTVFDIPA